MTTDKDPATKTVNVLLKVPSTLHSLGKVYGAANQVGVNDLYVTALRSFLVGRGVKPGDTGAVAASVENEVSRLVALSREIQSETSPPKRSR